MSLREKFEEEVKNNKSGVSVLFETSNQHYIEWLESKINKFIADASFQNNIRAAIERGKGTDWASDGEETITFDTFDSYEALQEVIKVIKNQL
jgi:hypothetical protein